MQHFFMNARELILLGCIVRFSRLFHPSNRQDFVRYKYGNVISVPLEMIHHEV